MLATTLAFYGTPAMALDSPTEAPEADDTASAAQSALEGAQPNAAAGPSFEPDFSDFSESGNVDEASLLEIAPAVADAVEASDLDAGAMYAASEADPEADPASDGEPAGEEPAATEGEPVEGGEGDDPAETPADPSVDEGADGADDSQDASVPAEQKPLYKVSDDATDEQADAVATYVFSASGTVFSKQSVRDGGTLSDPGTPAVPANKVFEGWRVQDATADLEFPATVAVERTATVTVEARFADVLHVTYYGSEGQVVLVEAVAAGDTLDTSAASAVKATAPEGQAFAGWSTRQDAAEPSDSITVAGDIALYPVFHVAHWIHFYENDGGAGGGASYTAPVYVEPDGDLSAAKPANPTRKGYHFIGWTLDEKGTQSFTWSGQLEDSVNLYAQWEVNEVAEYTLIFWKQKPTTGTAPSDYEYHSSTHRSGAPFTSISLASEDMSKGMTAGFEYFHYDRTDADEKTIDPAGRTVVNVYYNRDTVIFNFYEKDKKTLIESVQGPYDSYLPVRKDAFWEIKDKTYWLVVGEFNFDIPKQKGVLKHDPATNTWTVNAYEYAGTASRGQLFKQDLDESWPEAPAVDAAWDPTTWTYSEKFIGFSLYQARSTKESSFGGVAWSNVSAGESVANAKNIQIRYTRNQYDLIFVDDNHEVDSQKVYYEMPFDRLSGMPVLADTETERFVGWAADEPGTQLIWSVDGAGGLNLAGDVASVPTMPAQNMSVYAVWAPIRYHVVLDPNGGALTNAQIAEFNLDLGEVVSQVSVETNVTRDGWTLIAWYDEATGKPYGYGKVDSDVKLVARWARTGSYAQVVYDAVDGTDAPVDSAKYATSASVRVGTSPTAPAGKTFLGWKASDGTLYRPNAVLDLTTLGDDAFGDDNTVVLTAAYVAPGKAAIVYTANGGQGADRIVDQGADGDLRINEGVTALTEAESGFTRPGYTLLGWAYAADATEPDIALGEGLVASDGSDANVLYAVWQPIPEPEPEPEPEPAAPLAPQSEGDPELDADDPEPGDPMTPQSEGDPEFDGDEETPAQEPEPATESEAASAAEPAAQPTPAKTLTPQTADVLPVALVSVIGLAAAALLATAALRLRRRDGR